MVETIKAKWSENTGNRKAINEDVIAQGIKENSLVNSDELNAVVHRQDTMLDDLQRGNAWNIGKTYNIGDMIFLNVNYKRLSDAEGKKFKVHLYSLRDDNTQEPFKNNNNTAISFAKNYDYAVTQFIIQVDNDNTPLSHFVNTDYWHIVDATANDLSNATRLNVSNETKLGTLGSDSSIITFNKDLNINNDIITHADFNIKGDLKANRMTTNNNIAFNNAFCATPLKIARNNEIINAEWANNHLNGRVFELTPDSNVNTLPSPLYFYADNQGIPFSRDCYTTFLNRVSMDKIPLDLENKLTDYNYHDEIYKLFQSNNVPVDKAYDNYNLNTLLSLRQYALVFPQDFNMEDFSYLRFYIYDNDNISANKYQYDSLLINTSFFLEYKHLSYYNNYVREILDVSYAVGFLSGSFRPDTKIPQTPTYFNSLFLAVDFSDSFEMSVADLLGKNISNTSSLLSYSYHFDINPFDRGSFDDEYIGNITSSINKTNMIIKWEKEKRRLSFSLKLLVPNRSYGFRFNYPTGERFILKSFKLYLK